MTDINTTIRTIRQAEEVHKVLEGMKRHQRASTGPHAQTSPSGAVSTMRNSPAGTCLPLRMYAQSRVRTPR